MTKCTKQPSFESVSNENKNSKKNDSTQTTKLTLSKIINKIFCKFRNKYNHMPEIYEIIIIDNIIYNEKSHIVSTFKDLLIAYDYSDYLKRYYTYKESKVRLPKYFEYYNLYSKIFPNYTSIPEGKYFYLNIQRKQRMIDLQEKMENENKKKKIKNDNDDSDDNDNNIFNTSVFDSILNRTNREEMEMIFDVKYDDTKKNENIFVENINKIIGVINSSEIKEEVQIINNYEQKNEKQKKLKNKNNNKKSKEGVSPLMNININYINFNKFNEDKTNSLSLNNKAKNKAILFDKIFNVQKSLIKKSKTKVGHNGKKEPNPLTHSSMDKKDYNLFKMKINQMQKYKLVHDKSAYLNNNKNQQNKNKSNVDTNKNYAMKIKKNNSMIYDNKNNNEKLKNVFSYKALVSRNENNLDNQKLSIKSPLSSRNKRNDSELKYNGNFNFSLTTRYQKYRYYNKELPQNKTNFYKIDNSRNKNVPNYNFQFYTNNLSLKNCTLIHNSISPSGNKVSLKQKKKPKQNNSFFNKGMVFVKNKVGNFNYNKNNKRTVLKEKFLSKNIRNNSLNLNRNISYSIHSNKANHNNGNKNLKKLDLKNVINQKNKSLYFNNFLKIFSERTKAINK